MIGIHVSEGTAEGWFGPGKLSAILSILVLVVLILGTAFGVLTAINFWGEPDVSQPGVPVTPVAPAPTTAGTIQVPDGPKIKVVVNSPPELRVDWEKLDMAGFQLQLIGTMTNISKQTVKFSEIAFLLDGQQLAYIPGQTISPSGQIKIAKGFPGDYENAKVLEVKIKGFEVVGVSTTTPKPTTTEPTTKPSETVFTAIPNNPQTPGEVVAAFYFLCSGKEYSKAAELLTAELAEKIKSVGGLEQMVEKSLQGRKIERIEFGEITFYPEGKSATVYDATLYFTDGNKEDGGGIYLQKIDGIWKIAD